MRAAYLLANRFTHPGGVIHFLDVALFNAVKSVLLTVNTQITLEDDYAKALHDNSVLLNDFPASYGKLCSTINSLRMQLEWDIDVVVPERRVVLDYVNEVTRVMSHFEQYLKEKTGSA